MVNIVSRSPEASSDENSDTEDYINYVTKSAVPKAMTIKEFETDSPDYKYFKKVFEYLAQNKWFEQEDMKPYFLVGGKLNVKNYVVLKRNEIISDLEKTVMWK